MAQDYHHGARVQEITEVLQPIRTISTAVIGMVCTADDADAARFPLNEPVLITDVNFAAGKAGEKGTLARALNAIGNQAKPLAVVVRVPTGETPAEQTAYTIGGMTDKGQRTGLQALFAAKTKLDVTPRILGAPLLDNIDVTNELITLAQRTRSFVYAATNTETIEQAADYRKNFGQRELMLIHGDFESFNPASLKNDNAYTIANALGLRAKLDETDGWNKSISNAIINGVTGIKNPLSWDLQGPATDLGYLNEREITGLIRNNGFRLWGNRTCQTQGGAFPFECYTRTAQIMADTIAIAQFENIDCIVRATRIKLIIESINAKMRSLTREGYLLGGECWFDPKDNTEEILGEGKVFIDYDYGPTPPLENLMLRQRITGRYLVDLAAQIAA